MNSVVDSEKADDEMESSDIKEFELVKKPVKKTNRKQNGKNRKHRIDAKEQLVQERKERYNKLLYQSKKSLNQQVKVAKSFECAKLVRKLKSNGGEDVQDRLLQWKQIPNQRVVEVAIQRLGILNLDPDFTAVIETAQLNDPHQENLIEKLLSHKRVVTTIEEWNNKVTRYRRWYLQRQEIVHGNKFGDVSRPKKQKKEKSDARELFVNLGDNRDDKYDQYGPGAKFVIEEKKNRPGQRARRAKAMAVEARKAGRTWNKSINWREPKEKTVDEEQNTEKSREGKPKDVGAAKIASMGKTWRETGNDHPSWAAKSSQNQGIVAFQGKKITFD